MSAKLFDWSLISAISDEAFGIPPDVVFQIEENGRLHEIKAHRTILAIVSPTLKTMLYTTQVGDNTAKVVKIQQTTAFAFQTIIDAVYETKSIGDSLKGKSVKEVFDVVNLIEQYQIAQLKEAAKELLSDYPVTDDTVLDVAEEAMGYTTLFQTEAQQLLLNCAKFLKPKLMDASSIFNYAAENSNHKVFSALLAVMKDIKPTKCPNCRHEDCKNKKGVLGHEFRVNLIVSTNKDCGSWTYPDKGTGRVTRVERTSVYVESLTPGPTYKFDLNWDMKTSTGQPFFVFSCEELFVD